MKRILFAVLLFGFLLTGCGVSAQPEPEESKLPPVETPAPEMGAAVQLEMEHAVYDPSVDSFTYFIHNHSDETIEFGEPYVIQRWENGAWKDLTLRDNVGWIAIGYALQPGGVMALTCSFELYKESAETGTYRLVKEIGEETLYANFELGDSAYTENTPYGFVPLEDLPTNYSADTAEAADVVFTGEGIVNESAVEEFLHKATLGAGCQLRTVQDYGENTPMVTDVIYEGDYFLWRMLHDGVVTEKRFSYIVTDGAALYLSNGADWENTLKYDSDKTLLVPEGTLDQLVADVEDIAAARLEGNVTRYKIWSAGDKEGIWSAELVGGDLVPNSDTEFFIEWRSSGGGGRGSSFNLQNWNRPETAIRAIAWQENGTLRMDCDTTDGKSSILYFDPEAEALT